MPYTNDPANSDLDHIRLLVGDTSSSPELSDAEVSFLLDSEGDARRAAARAAEVLAARYYKVASEKRVGPLWIKNATDKAKQYETLAKRLWASATKVSGMPFAGGISAADKATREQDHDRVAPSFGRDMMTYPASNTTHITPKDS